MAWFLIMTLALSTSLAAATALLPAKRPYSLMTARRFDEIAPLMYNTKK